MLLRAARAAARRTPLAARALSSGRASKPSTGAPSETDAWTHSEERTEQLRQTERIALGVFLATAPFVYGLFWWYGVIELPWGRSSAPSSGAVGRAPSELERPRDGAAPFAAGTPWDSPGFTPCTAFEGARPGYVFTTGEQGLGYYPDRAGSGA